MYCFNWLSYNRGQHFLQWLQNIIFQNNDKYSFCKKSPWNKIQRIFFNNSLSNNFYSTRSLCFSNEFNCIQFIFDKAILILYFWKILAYSRPAPNISMLLQKNTVSRSGTSYFLHENYELLNALTVVLQRLAFDV